jgi:signal transduction histidine kinase
MRERVAALRGSLDVESGPGQGTTVVATIPAGDAE